MLATVGRDPVLGVERFTGGSDNLADGIDFVVLYFEYGRYGDAIMDWANAVLATNKHRRAIVVTHHAGGVGQHVAGRIQAEVVHLLARDHRDRARQDVARQVRPVLATAQETSQEIGENETFDLEETVRNSPRVVVLRDRRKVAELNGEEITEHNIMHAIAKTEVAR